MHRKLMSIWKRVKNTFIKLINRFKIWITLEMLVLKVILNLQTSNLLFWTITTVITKAEQFLIQSSCCTMKVMPKCVTHSKNFKLSALRVIHLFHAQLSTNICHNWVLIRSYSQVQKGHSHVLSTCPRLYYQLFRLYLT